MKSTKRIYLSYLLLLLIAVSCKQKGNEDLDLAASSQQNVNYGTDAKQTFDYYLPAKRTTSSTKVLILIHGGAWSDGDKSDFSAYMDTLRRRLPDYALFNINYRLASFSGNVFPTQELDVKAAVEYIMTKRNDYNISDKVVLLGASAGGHLALLQGYKNSSSVKPRAIVNFFGPSDMAAMYNSPAPAVNPTAIAFLVGGTPATNALAYTQSSPITYVNAQSAPTLTFQGGVDPLVNPSQQAALHAKLQEQGVVNEYVFYPSEGHGWFGDSLSKSFNKIEAFLAANVK